MIIRFETANAAFEDNGLAEYRAIFDQVAEAIENGGSHGRLFDSNGNKVGDWSDEES